MEIQQSPLFADYIKDLGWTIEKVGSFTMFIRHFFFLGSIAKLQRTTKLPAITSIISLVKKHNIRQIIVEPDSRISQKSFTLWLIKLKSFVHISSSHYLSTKTIRVDLRATNTNIFNRFTEAKRRAVRKAIKNEVTIKESSDITQFLKLKAATAGFLGGITTYGICELWQQFSPNNATILLAQTKDRHIVGGVLILYWDNVAYYWIAGATKVGKKLFAPTLLVWEALTKAKSQRCTSFDFVGVWDERLPKENLPWKGFTKFKEGFGGTPLYYPLSHHY